MLPTWNRGLPRRHRHRASAATAGGSARPRRRSTGRSSPTCWRPSGSRRCPTSSAGWRPRRHAWPTSAVGAAGLHRHRPRLPDATVDGSTSTRRRSPTPAATPPKPAWPSASTFAVADAGDRRRRATTTWCAASRRCTTWPTRSRRCRDARAWPRPTAPSSSWTSAPPTRSPRTIPTRCSASSTPPASCTACPSGAARSGRRRPGPCMRTATLERYATAAGFAVGRGAADRARQLPLLPAAPELIATLRRPARRRANIATRYGPPRRPRCPWADPRLDRPRSARGPPRRGPDRGLRRLRPDRRLAARRPPRWGR